MSIMPLEFIHSLFHWLKRGGMDYERNRLATFRGDWKNPFVSVRDLAAAGFFFRAPDEKDGKKEDIPSDVVECHFCGGRLYDWEIGDVPWFDHAHNFPLCPLIIGEPTLNVPIYSTEDLERSLEGGDHVAVIDQDLKVKSSSAYYLRKRPLAVIHRDSTIEYIYGKKV